MSNSTQKVIENAQPWLPPLSDLLPSLEKIWETKWLTNDGEMHQKLQSCLASYLGTPNLRLFSSGATALMAIIRALDVHGTAITTPFTFAATAHCLLWNNIKPIFVDVDEKNGNIDADKIEEAILPSTKIILATHCFGVPCDVKKIEKIAKKHGLKVIYDAAHAFGVRIHGKSLASFGDAAALSFHATKLFHTVEGGAVVCHDLSLHQKVTQISNHGISKSEPNIMVGLNGKMSELHAAIGLSQIDFIERILERRQEIFKIYKIKLGDVVGVTLLERKTVDIDNAAYVPVLINEHSQKSRDSLIHHLAKDGVVSRPYFFPLITDMCVYSEFSPSKKSNLPVAKSLANRVLCLPISFNMTNEDVGKVIDSLKKWDSNG